MVRKVGEFSCDRHRKRESTLKQRDHVYSSQHARLQMERISGPSAAPPAPVEKLMRRRKKDLAWKRSHRWVITHGDREWQCNTSAREVLSLKSFTACTVIQVEEIEICNLPDGYNWAVIESEVARFVSQIRTIYCMYRCSDRNYRSVGWLKQFHTVKRTRQKAIWITVELDKLIMIVFTMIIVPFCCNNHECHVPLLLWLFAVVQRQKHDCPQWYPIANQNHGTAATISPIMST